MFDTESTSAVTIADAMTIALNTPTLIDIGGISGSFTEVKIQTAQIVEGAVHMNIIPGNAGAMSRTGTSLQLSSARPETVEALRVAMKMVGEDWLSGVTAKV